MLAYMGMFLFLVYIQLLASANYNTFRKQLGSKGELGTLRPKNRLKTSGGDWNPARSFASQRII